MRGKRVILAAGVLLTAPLAWSQADSPYALDIDRAAYVLQKAGGDGYASAARGGTWPAPPYRERPELVTKTDCAAPAIASRESSQRQDYDQQLAQLAYERDSWKRRAEALEAALRTPSAWPPPLIPPGRR